MKNGRTTTTFDEFVNLVFSEGRVGVLLSFPGKGWNESSTSQSRSEEHQSEGRPCEFNPLQ
jgi:hypothetical protein